MTFLLCNRLFWTSKAKHAKALYGPMPQRKYPRIEIDQLAYDGLQIEAVFQHRTIREIATEALLSHISREALSVLDHKTTSPEDIATKRPLDHKTSEGVAIDSNGPGTSQKRNRLADNPDALRQIREMWYGGMHNGTEIAKRINYPKATVAEHIKKLKKEGLLDGEVHAGDHGL